MKKSLLVTLFLIMAGCTTNSTTTSTPINNATTNTTTGTPVVVLKRTECRGFCPVYTIKIYADGTVQYNGELNVEVTGKQTSKISEEAVNNLVANFESIDYFTLKDSYSAQNVTDLPSVITSLTVDGETKTVKHYLGDDTAPEDLTTVENEVDEVVNSDQWVEKMNDSQTL